MNEASRVVSLDIGTSTIEIVVADVLHEENGMPRLHILGLGTAASRGLRKGVVINIDATIQSISEAIEQAEAMSGTTIKQVVASLSGSHIQCVNSHGIVGVRDGEVSRYDVEKVIEAARAIALPFDREILQVIPREFIVDEQDGIRDPRGMSGVRLEAKVHILTALSASAQNLVKCANRCGLQVQDIALTPLAAARAVLSKEEQTLGACVIDIGGGTTGICIYQDGAVRHTAILPVGGSHITNDIAAGLRTPIAAAEGIKKRYGTVLASTVVPEEIIEVPSTGGRSPRVLSRLILAEIIEPRVREIFELVQETIRVEGIDPQSLSSGIVLCGGSSELHGMSALAEDIFRVPVRVGDIESNDQFTITGLADLVRGPENAAAVGLLQYASREGGTLYKKYNNRVGKLVKRVGNWLAEHF